jgi:hypothetical protein
MHAGQISISDSPVTRAFLELFAFLYVVGNRLVPVGRLALLDIPPTLALDSA